MPDRSVGLPTLLRRSVGPLGRIAVANRGGWLDVVGRIHAVLAVLGGHHDPVPVRAGTMDLVFEPTPETGEDGGIGSGGGVLTASHMVSPSYGQGYGPGGEKAGLIDVQAGDKVFEKDDHHAPDVQELRGTYKVYHVTDLNVANVRPRAAPNAPAALGVPLGRPPGERRPCRARCRARPPEATLAAARNEGVATVVLHTPPRTEDRGPRDAARAAWWGHPVPAADGRPRDRSATVKLRQLLGGPATVAVLLAVPPRGQRTDQARGDCSASACGCARTRPGIAPPGAMPSPWADSGRASAHGPCRGRAAAAWSFPSLRNNRSCSMAKKPNLALVADAAAVRKPAPGCAGAASGTRRDRCPDH